ncbi:MAG: helix-turn-helix domain-containing protein [Candidatus Saccharimonadales bacterium]
MNSPDISLPAYFQRLGLSDHAARVYVALHTHGEQTISDISRHSGVERTRVYRVLPELRSVGLIEQSSEYARDLYRAAPLSNVQILISKREQDLVSLASYLPLVEQSLHRNAESVSQTRVQVYRGVEGLKQMLWNETKASSEVLSIMPEVIQLRTKAAFFKRWVTACNDRGLTFRSIIGSQFDASRTRWYDRHVNERLQNWQGRVIDDTSLAITHHTIIYDDVVGYFAWDKELVGIEIHNPLIAATQRQMFELLWSSAR